MERISFSPGDLEPISYEVADSDIEELIPKPVKQGPILSMSL